MNIHGPIYIAKTQRGAKIIAKREPWHVDYMAVKEFGTVVEDNEGNWWIYIIDHSAKRVYGNRWIILKPSINSETGEREPFNFRLSDYIKS